MEFIQNNDKYFKKYEIPRTVETIPYMTADCGSSHTLTYLGV